MLLKRTKVFLSFLKLPTIYTLVIAFLAFVDYVFRRSVYFPSFIYASLCIFFFLTGCFFLSKTLMKIIGSITIIFMFLLLYCFTYLKVPIYPYMIWLLLFQTSAKEISSFIDFSIVILLIITIIFIWILWSVRSKKLPYSLLERLILGALFIFLSFQVYPYIKKGLDSNNKIEKSFPFSGFPNLRIAKAMLQDIYKQNNVADFSKQIDFSHPRKVQIILSIGESLRGDHLSINGYKRNTTPYLRNLLEKGQLQNFGLAKSCGDLTFKSWRYLLMGLSCSQNPFFEQRKTIAYYLKKAKFNTSIIAQNDEDSILFAVKESENKKNIVDYKQNIALGYESNKSYNPYFFEILNSIGSHLPYVQYPDDLAYFKPDDTSIRYRNYAQNISTIINRYDNAVLYLDMMTNYILKDLAKSPIPAIYIYTSDHGETLGEYSGFFGHGNDTTESYMVPLFVFMNDAFKKAYRAEYLNIVKNSKLYKNRLTHEVIFHTVLDLAGLKNKPNTHVIDFSKSLIRKKFLPQLEDDWFVSETPRN